MPRTLETLLVEERTRHLSLVYMPRKEVMLYTLREKKSVGKSGRT